MLIRQTLIAIIFIFSITVVYSEVDRIVPPAKMAARYPLLTEANLCYSSFLSSFTNDDTIPEILMKRTYSYDCSATKDFYSDLFSVYGKRSSYIDDVIDIIVSKIKNSLIAEKKHGMPLRIIHMMNLRKLTKRTGIKGIGGLYNNLDNIFYFVAKNNSSQAFIHEATHAVINSIFKNHSELV